MPESGWLADGTNIASAAKFSGDASKAHWFLDEELARACATLNHSQRGKRPQMVTFTQNGKPMPIGPRGFVPLAFAPEADGLTIKLGAEFLGEIPPGLVEQGTKLGHAKTAPGMHVCGGGSLRQISADTFRVQFGPLGLTPKALQCWLVATATGDSEFRACVQPGQIVLPKTSNDWKVGHITFPTIGKIARDAKPFGLRATADNGLPVDFFVKSGPAEIADGKLSVTKIPPRAKLPLKIILVAHQWGRAQSEPVEQTVPVD